MQELLRIARTPALITSSGVTVLEVSQQMVTEKVGAIAVVDDGRMVGIISERDVVSRVVVPRRDPATTLVGDVMTKNPRTATDGMTILQALELMHDGRFRHLPLLDAKAQVIGMLSMRHLLSHRLSDLDVQNADLLNFIAADGPGG
jgi:CBS domain-containing protein